MDPVEALKTLRAVRELAAGGGWPNMTTLDFISMVDDVITVLDSLLSEKCAHGVPRKYCTGLHPV